MRTPTIASRAGIAAFAAALAGAPAAQADPLAKRGLDRAPSERLLSYPAGAFLESVAVRADGALLVVDHTSRELRLVTRAGDSRALARLAKGAAGVALDLDGQILVTSGYRAEGGVVSVLTADGALAQEIAAPGSVFPNGAALISPGRFLVADSVRGRLYLIDTQTAEASVWFEHALLAPVADRPRYPGANGVKVNRGAVFVTNSAQEILARIPIADGGPGAPEIIARDVVLDDIAIAASGVIYGATHPDNSVVRIDLSGAVTTIATAEDGVTGATALAFGRTAADADTVYVVTSGGVYFPPETGVEPANIVRLGVGEPGAPPLARLSHLPYPGRAAPFEGWLVRCGTAEGDTAAIRDAHGPAYLAYLEANFDRIAFAGQYFGDESPSPSARFYVVSAASRDAAQRMMAASPYAREGLYSQCEAGRFTGLLGGLLGGVAWPDAASRAEP